MHYLTHLLQVQLVLFLIVQVALLILQGGALRRHGNRCFVLLVASTVCGVLLLIANGAPVFLTPTQTMLVWCYSLGFIFGVAQAFFGLIGVALLFRDYRRLADNFSNTSAQQKINDKEAEQ